MMEFSKSGTRSVNKGPAENFTGDVYVEPYHTAQDPSRVLASSVTFSPCARTAWHSHPLGQLLVITKGNGFVQERGQPVRHVHQGDVVWTPPGVEHWHGAGPTSKMTHIAILESLNGKTGDWKELVAEDEYRAACACCEAGSFNLSDVSPALAKYDQEILQKVWSRPGLSARDRSVVTISALIARNQKDALPMDISLALDNGVKPREISEIITHLAFYSGWGAAMSAVETTRSVFARRSITETDLPLATPELLPLNISAENARAENVERQFNSVSPGVVSYTADVLFKDLWLRPDLPPRDRSLVTVSALIASGHVAQITYHLNRAMDNGLTQEETSEVLTQLAFYAGWPNVFSAMPVVKEVLEKRQKQSQNKEKQ